MELIVENLVLSEEDKIYIERNVTHRIAHISGEAELRQAESISHHLHDRLGEKWIVDIIPEIHSQTEAFHTLDVILNLSNVRNLSSSEYRQAAEYFKLDYVSKFKTDRSSRSVLMEDIFRNPDAIVMTDEDREVVISSIRQGISNFVEVCTEVTQSDDDRESRGFGQNWIRHWQDDVFKALKLQAYLNHNFQNGNRDQETISYIKSLIENNNIVFDDHFKSQVYELIDAIQSGLPITRNHFTYPPTPIREREESENYLNSIFEDLYDEEDPDDEEDLNEEEFRFSSHGLSAMLFESSSFNVSFTANNREYDTTNQSYLDIDFLPGGISSFDSNIFLPLYYGYLGFKDLIDYIKREHPKLYKDDLVIFGSTNYRMAQAATRMGFSIVDSDRISKEELAESSKEDALLDKRRARVVATIGDIKRALAKMEEATIGGKKGYKPRKLLDYLKEKVTSET